MGTAVEICLALCRRFEGFSSKPYLCPAGVPTIGYGTTYYEDGRKVTLSDPPITRDRAEALLALQLQGIYLRGVLKASPNVIKYNGTFGALGSFAYNLGVPRYRSSTLRKRINEENWPEARIEIQKWVRAGGRRLKGLIRRRAVEATFLGT